MYDPISVIKGKVQSLLLVHYSQSAINATGKVFKKHANISILIRQKKLMLHDSCCAMMSHAPFISWLTTSRSRPEGFRKIILGGNLIDSLTTT